MYSTLEDSRRADERAPFVVLPESVEWSPDGLPDVEQPLGRDTADWIWYTQRPAAAAAAPSQPPAAGAAPKKWLWAPWLELRRTRMLKS